MSQDVRLTEYSHGAGCGCKIAPAILQKILGHGTVQMPTGHLWVGHDTKDDAAVVSLGDGTGVVSTTDFFMPIVDDPFTFGRIAATNALSDIYAMGGTPLLAIAILGWPIKSLPPETAGQVIDGGREACRAAGIPLAGGHSIDAPEPIFGLAVTGRVSRENLTRNQGGKAGDVLCLTKPIGIGILTTAMKRGVLAQTHETIVTDVMCRLNDFGVLAGQLSSVHAMTDVTGFGLLGHLLEICENDGLAADVDWPKVPQLPGIEAYVSQGCSPGGAQRNFDSYGHKLSPLSSIQTAILCDPQTSGGLLLVVDPEGVDNVQAQGRERGIDVVPIGRLKQAGPDDVTVQIVSG